MHSTLIERHCRKHIFLCTFLFLCFLVSLSITNFYQLGVNRELMKRPRGFLKIGNVSSKTGERKAEIVILMWGKFFDLDEDSFLKLVHNGVEDSDKTCFNGVKITYDRGQLERATAIVIYHHFQHLNIDDLPKTRRADQLWVLYGNESPMYSPNLKEFNNMFNWTMTYRKDSDVYAPYGKYWMMDQKENEIYINGVLLNDFVRSKTVLLTAVISFCFTHGERDAFVEKLNAEGNMTVDIFGRCGKPICDRLNDTCNHGKWWRELGAKYKFYFAAENAICTDYITEKFWRALEIGMVPLVYGGGNYSQFAPPHSFIDVRDFRSVKHVADFLKRLDKNETEYKRYFEWRKKYKVGLGEGSVDTWTGLCLQGWCELSNKVKEFRDKLDKSSNPRILQALFKTYHDLSGWWRHEAGDKKFACGMPPI